MHLSPKPKEEKQRQETSRRGGDLFIVVNSDSQWKVREYLREWSDISNKFDIATGSLEIGALLALDGNWQKLDKIRVLMGRQTYGKVLAKILLAASMRSSKLWILASKKKKRRMTSSPA